MTSEDLTSHELPDVAELVKAVAMRESVRRGRFVSTHDLSVQVGVADIILGGVGKAMRTRYERMRRHGLPRRVPAGNVEERRAG